MTEIFKVDGIYLIDNPSNKIVGTAKISYGSISFFIKIINGAKGIFPSLPSIWNKEKESFEPAFGIEQEDYFKLAEIVKNSFEQKLKSKEKEESNTAENKEKRIVVEETLYDNIPF